MSSGDAETWSWREGPLLRIVLRETDAGRNPEFEQLADQTGLERQQVSIAMRALQDAGYVDVYLAGAYSGVVHSVGERARRELGSWPSAETIAADVVTALAEAADREPDEGRKKWLKSIASGAAGVGRGVLTAEITAVLRKYGLIV
jgi:DNA-binding transcriptional ArsR family regulator